MLLTIRKVDGSFFIKQRASLLYNDLPDDEAGACESRLIPQSYAVQASNIKLTAYKYVPSTYVICEKDMAAPPEYQEMFAKVAAAKVYKLASGHMPMLSQLAALIDIITATVRTSKTGIRNWLAYKN
jgi:pimeloyl-ACP methyl ester carboxylesterase